MTRAVNVPTILVEKALQIDLIGPVGAFGDHAEMLPPSLSWVYLTGFLVPTDTDEGQRCDPPNNDELDQAAESAGIEDDDSPENAAARRSFLADSVGVSVLVPETLGVVQAAVRYRVFLPVGSFPVWTHNCMMYVALEPSHIRALQE